MPSQISYREYAQAVLDSVRSGAFPENEEVISAELPPSAVPTVLKLIDEARNDVKVCHQLHQMNPYLLLIRCNPDKY